ncbi:MAG: hypothetical protein WC001_06205 [Desulfurivibrionaceae bacterium]
MDTDFLFRGVSEAFHCTNGGLLKPKVQGPFTYGFHWDEHGFKFDSGVTWDSTPTNAVIRHQLGQQGFPTSGISTTPHLERAIFYTRSQGGISGGYVFKISRKALQLEGIEQFVVSQFCKPSVPEDDEVILVVQNGFHLPAAVVVEVVKVPPLTDGTV